MRTISIGSAELRVVRDVLSRVESGLPATRLSKKQSAALRTFLHRLALADETNNP